MENTKRRDVWSDREVHQMLSIINEKHGIRLLDSKTKRNKNIFVDVANELKKENILKNDVQIRNKFKSLKCDFYKTQRSNNISDAKRQTSEHFELLNEIFGQRLALEAEEGIDVAEMDVKNIDIETISAAFDEQSQASEKSVIIECNATAKETSSRKEKTRSFKKTRKQSYQKVVESFANDWKKSQQELLQTLMEQDKKLAEEQTKQQEEMMQKNLTAMEKILEKDREETAKMFQVFLNSMQPVNQAEPYMFHISDPESAFMEPSASNSPRVVIPKLSPQECDETFPPL
ncbi:translation initiation factor IF-2-like [Rhagoletis pomonella]|uniref:translation initiation factor IF-2-like n=1 Tax=Rhagoletis pomonella TaxID=28610 RepID=UPI00177FA8B6|nr:translation initiation factor IF-2-like [Rhagoletis pomonella]